ncbi:XRE family transcriptional regulator [Cutibacterium acnes]|nr:XRE family transcriptional regulator [Cutibacterium acnes]
MSRIHKRGVLSGYTADEAVGITVNSLMFRKRLTRVELGRAFFWGGGGTPAAAGRKLRGEIGWSIGDLFHVAEFLGVEVSTLLPARVEKIPANPEADGELVAGTGFEPVTSGL